MEDSVWKDFDIQPLSNAKVKYPLYDYQKYAVYCSLSMSHYILGLQTGLGKTACAYASYYYYKEKYPNTKLIVVSNKSALFQMQEQLHKFFQVSEAGKIIHNDMDKLKKEKYAEARKRIISQFGEMGNVQNLDILWMGYTIFTMNISDIEQAILKFKMEGYKLFVIFDESTSFINMGTLRFKAVSKISRVADKVLGLTATLCKGKLEQIYSIFKGMSIKVFTNKSNFMDKYCIVWRHPKKPYIMNIRGYQNVRELVEKIRPYTIVLRKADVAVSLPKFTISKTYLEHSKEQIKMISGIYTGEIDIEEYIKDFKGFDENNGGLRGGVETNFIKMALLDERTVTQKNLQDYKTLSPKTDEIIRGLEEDFVDEKIVIYTHSKRYLLLLANTIKKTKGVPDMYRKVLEIHGGISARDREKNKKLFSEDEKYNILILNNAGIEALNLQVANTILVTTLPDSFGGLTQLAGRISRIDSLHKNLYLKFYLIKDSQDEDEYRIIMQQGVLTKNILDEPEEGLIDYSVLLQDSGISKEEYQSKSLSRLILSCRKRRAALYMRKFKKG